MTRSGRYSLYVNANTLNCHGVPRKPSPTCSFLLSWRNNGWKVFRAFGSSILVKDFVLPPKTTVVFFRNVVANVFARKRLSLKYWLRKPMGKNKKPTARRTSRRTPLRPVEIWIRYLLHANQDSIIKKQKTNDILWNRYINYVVSSASKSLRLIGRNLHEASEVINLTEYKCYVRSQLYFPNLIWNSYQLFLVKKLEAIQNDPARFTARDYSWISSVTPLKDRRFLPPLSVRSV